MTANPTVTRRNFLLGAALCATMLSGCNQGDGGQAPPRTSPPPRPLQAATSSWPTTRHRATPLP